MIFKIERIFGPILAAGSTIVLLLLAASWCAAITTPVRANSWTGLPSQSGHGSVSPAGEVMNGGVESDLSVSISALPGQVVAGQAITFSVVITYKGPVSSTTTATMIGAVSPSNSADSWSLPSDCTGLASSGRITCTMDLPAGVPPIVGALEWQVTSSLTFAGWMTGQVTVTSILDDIDATNNQDQVAVTVTSPPLSRVLFIPLIGRQMNLELPPPLPAPILVTVTTPIDFAAIRADLQAAGQDLAFAEIGFHVGIDGNTAGLTQSLETLDGAGVPFFLKSADNAEPLFIAQGLMRQSGVSHTLVYRRTGLGYDLPNYDLLPELAAQQHWQYHRDAFPPELDPSLVWVETVNEVDKNRSEWLGDFALATAQLALADGRRWAAFGWSSGEPEEYHWESPSMLSFLRLAGEHPEQLAIALHEYSYAVDDIGRWYPHLIGRFQMLFQVCDRHGIPRPTVLITEWGWTAEDVPLVAPAMDDFAWAAWLYAAYPQVRGAATWYLGVGYGDIADQVQQLIMPWRDYALTHYYIIEQGQGQVDPRLFQPSPFGRTTGWRVAGDSRNDPR